MENKDIARFLYEQRIQNEKPIENPDGESLALLELFEEINALGYDFHYRADIDLRPTKDVRVMALLWKYFPRMESIFTKQIFIRRIDPKRFPAVLDYAMETFRGFSPSDKMLLPGFDEVISKGKRSDSYFDRISELLSDGDAYATLWDTRRTLGKYCPDMLRKHTETYRHGVLLPLTLLDCLYYPDTATTDFLKSCLDMTEAELSETVGRYDYKNNGYRYPLSVTMFEYRQRLCTPDLVKREAEKVLRAREKKQKISS